jgi:hypothetical protein
MKLLKEFIPKLCHDADGLIFQVRFVLCLFTKTKKMLSLSALWPVLMYQVFFFP